MDVIQDILYSVSVKRTEVLENGSILKIIVCLVAVVFGGTLDADTRIPRENGRKIIHIRNVIHRLRKPVEKRTYGTVKVLRIYVVYAEETCFVFLRNVLVTNITHAGLAHRVAVAGSHSGVHILYHVGVEVHAGRAYRPCHGFRAAQRVFVNQRKFEVNVGVIIRLRIRHGNVDFFWVVRNILGLFLGFHSFETASPGKIPRFVRNREIFAVVIYKSYHALFVAREVEHADNGRVFPCERENFDFEIFYHIRCNGFALRAVENSLIVEHLIRRGIIVICGVERAVVGDAHIAESPLARLCLVEGVAVAFIPHVEARTVGGVNAFFVLKHKLAGVAENFQRLFPLLFEFFVYFAEQSFGHG